MTLTLTSRTTTQAVVNHHLGRFVARDLQGVVADYAPDAVMIVRATLPTSDGLPRRPTIRTSLGPIRLSSDTARSWCRPSLSRRHPRPDLRDVRDEPTPGVTITPMETRREVIVHAAVLADELGYEVFSVPEGWGLDSTLVLAEIALRTRQIHWTLSGWAATSTSGDAHPHRSHDRRSRALGGESRTASFDSVLSPTDGELTALRGDPSVARS
jgi:hypothetical protein